MKAPRQARGRRSLEIMLIVVVIGMTTLFILMREHRLLALNLFYLPVIISGYFLGRYSAGVLALLSALTVTVSTILFPQQFASYVTPTEIAITLTLWSAVLGLAAILIGTLCDERASTVSELQRAYVGMAEVLSRYLHGNDPQNSSRAQRVARLCNAISDALRLPPKHADDIRVAALLHDLGEVEITTKLIRRAVDSLEHTDPYAHSTFTGGDLVESLGEVLQGAVPLLATQDEGVMSLVTERGGYEVPFGVHVIRAARTYDQLSFDGRGRRILPHEAVIQRMHVDAAGPYALVLDVLARAAQPQSTQGVHEQTFPHPPVLEAR